MFHASPVLCPSLSEQGALRFHFVLGPADGAAGCTNGHFFLGSRSPNAEGGESGDLRLAAVAQLSLEDGAEGFRDYGSISPSRGPFGSEAGPTWASERPHNCLPRLPLRIVKIREANN